MDNQNPQYQAYLNSFSWHFKRWLRLNYAGHKCEICGSKTGLQCHHKTYIRLYRERISDLQILCEVCHPIEDEKRRRDKAIMTFASKKWGEGWQESVSWIVASQEFDKWLSSKG